MQILIATTNKHKLREIEEVLLDPSLTLISLAEIENAPEVVHLKLLRTAILSRGMP